MLQLHSAEGDAATMLPTMMTVEGTWEEVTRDTGRFAGKRVRIIVLPDEGGDATPQRPFYEAATPEEWARAFGEWAAGHHRSTPLLSDAAISRDSIYGDEE